MISGGAAADYIEFVGYNNGGTVTQTGGVFTSETGALFLGNSKNSNGEYNLSGNGSMSVELEEIGYYYGSGVFNQSGGTNVATQDLDVGAGSGTVGSYTLSTGSLTVIGDEAVGRTYSTLVGGSSGFFTQSGGINTIEFGVLEIGAGLGSVGTYSLIEGT